MGSTYVEPDPGFALAQRSIDYLEFDLRQSDADDAEPDTDADGKTFTLRLALDSDPSTVVLEKTATASAGIVRFDFEASDLPNVVMFLGTVWDDETGQACRPTSFAVPVLATVGGST